MMLRESGTSREKRETCGEISERIGSSSKKNMDAGGMLATVPKKVQEVRSLYVKDRDGNRCNYAYL